MWTFMDTLKNILCVPLSIRYCSGPWNSLVRQWPRSCPPGAYIHMGESDNKQISEQLKYEVKLSSI